MISGFSFFSVLFMQNSMRLLLKITLNFSSKNDMNMFCIIILSETKHPQQPTAIDQSALFGTISTTHLSSY